MPNARPRRAAASMSPRSRVGLVWAAVLLAAAAPARADLLITKDGFIIQGKAVREHNAIYDPHAKRNETIATGSFFIDDGARRIYLSPSLVQTVEDKIFRPADGAQAVSTIRALNPARPPAVVEVLRAGPFDDKWDRTFLFKGYYAAEKLEYNVAVPQHLQELNTQYARADATKHFWWAAHYLTAELGPDQVRKLLLAHKDFKDSSDLKPAERAQRRFRLFRFLVHAGWYAAADAELDRIAEDLPEEKSKVVEEREKVKTLWARQQFEEVQRAHRTGRHQFVRERLSAFPERYATNKMLDDARSLRAFYSRGETKMNDARALLADLVKRVEGDDRAMFAEAATAVQVEMHLDNVGRLDTFVEQAKQAARREKAGAKPEQSPAELLALAVSGWLLGNNSAEAKVDQARKLWAARQFVLAWLKADGAEDRRQLAAKYQAAKYGLSIDEVAEVLSLLQPPPSEAAPPKQITEYKVDGAAYVVKLPPEYNPARAYPVLLVLHDGAGTAREMLERWQEKAGADGYILAAPKWGQGGLTSSYGYTPEEHATVSETLRDLRRRFHVDCDRVFLFGLGDGGTMALDVGLSHPGLFAGVLPMSGNADHFCRFYWPNAQYLPLYIVNGDYSGIPHGNIRKLFERWVPSGCPTMFVQYKGRGLEWFPAEVTPMLDWMRPKRRNTPVSRLGSYGKPNGGFVTMRPTDNRFYWLSSDAIHPRHYNRADPWNPRVFPAEVAALVEPSLNQISLSQRGFSRLTIWLARDARIDFDKPVKLYVNSHQLGQVKAKPSLEVLLEDYATRGDRARLFVAKIELKLEP